MSLRNLFKQCMVCSILLLVLIVFGNPGSARAETLEILGEGEDWETEIFKVTGREEGPTVFVVGGVHGNEPAGAYAAEELLQSLSLSRGVVLLLPRANVQALAEGRRSPVGGSDLNRAFAVEEPGSWTEELAREILNAVEAYEVDIILDLHEAWGFYQTSNSVGQTVIFNDHGDAPFIAMHLITEINRGIDERHVQFTYIGPTAQGSLTRVAGERWGIPTFIFETTTSMALDVRIGFQKQLVYYTLEYLNMVESDLPAMVE